jgi:hypothetical protein
MTINLDQYYTDKKIASHCILTAFEKISNITEIIEPSAGAGSFSLQIDGCIAYDIKPNHNSIIQENFLALKLPYKKGRLFIGNPPFGTRNALSVKFYKQAIMMGDSIAFILPASQFNNNQQMYDFDLIHSEMLPLIEFSGIKKLCCFNIFTRPESGNLNKKPINYTLSDVTILEWRRGGNYPVPGNYDFGVCSWGSVGKEIEFQGQFSQENYLIIKNQRLKDCVITAMKKADWSKLYPHISTPRLTQWKIYKYLKDQIPCLK